MIAIKIRNIVTVALWLAVALAATAANGLPFFRNHTPEQYGAHNRNFMVVGDDYGRVYVANFEGLLYYDQCSWHVIHTPGSFRVTQIYKASDGRIWVGGYNHLGYLTTGRQGQLELKMVWSINDYRGQASGFLGAVNKIGEKKGGVELTAIGETDGHIYIETPHGRDYLTSTDLKGIEVRKAHEAEKLDMYQGVQVNQRLAMPDGRQLLATAGRGLIMLNADGSMACQLDEQAGLCNNNVNGLYLTKDGHLWGATERGVFHVEINSAFSFFPASYGLEGSVEFIQNTTHGLYVGTLKGLFRYNGHSFQQVQGISQGCWDLTETDGGQLVSATSQGLFEVSGTRSRQLTHSLSFSVLPLGHGEYIVAEADGLYYVGQGKHQMVNPVEKAMRLIKDKGNVFWAQNIYGQVFRCLLNKERLSAALQVMEPAGKDYGFNNYLFPLDGKMYMWTGAGVYVWQEEKQAMVAVGNEWTKTTPWPQYVFGDPQGYLWVSNNDSRNFRAYSFSHKVDAINEPLSLLRNIPISHVESVDRHLYMSSGETLMVWDKQGSMQRQTPKVLLRRISLNGDSLIWGGFADGERLQAEVPFKSITLPNGIKRFDISYATTSEPTVGQVEYRYRINGGEWTDWSAEETASFINPHSGTYSIDIVARVTTGMESEPVSIEVVVDTPVWLRWYMIVLYVLLLGAAVYSYTKYRTRRLLREKEQLENIVEQRTAKINQQKEELIENAAKLQQALDDLSSAQAELIRQEKMATVGKVTQGLVDRILNPMNYINNFSHMSQGLIGEALENIEDEKPQMDEDNYEDTVEVLGMVKGNLSEIEQHGINTTRILKAMEEMLRERGGNKMKVDLTELCRTSVDMLRKLNAEDISTMGISIEAPAEGIVAHAMLDTTQISKSIMSMLSNSLYAIKKKHSQQPYQGELKLLLERDEERRLAVMTLYDNGTGIEPTILSKVFDPFFTTKTTAEAAGVGLYFTRDAIVSHGGTIDIDSKVHEYTRITVTLPLAE